MERFGVRRVVAAALALVALGSGLTLVMTSRLAAVAALGLRGRHRHRLAGPGVRRDRRQPLVRAAPRRGHRRLLAPPARPASWSSSRPSPRLADGPGWRWAAGLVAVFALLLVPLVWWCCATTPADVGHHGVRRRGRLGAAVPARRDRASGAAARWRSRTLRESARSRTFWILFVTFWICGWSTNGLIGTHFIPAAHDHGMPATTSAGLLALIGIFDIIGTVASGWLTDRVDSATCCSATTSSAGSRCSPCPGCSARTSTRACSSSSCSTASTGWRRCRRRSRCAASTSASRRSGRGLRLGLRRAHGRRRRRGQLRRLDPHRAGRLLRSPG